MCVNVLNLGKCLGSERMKDMKKHLGEKLILL